MIPLVTKEDFCKKIESLVINKNYTYLDAVLALQEHYGMDYSLVAKFLSQPLKEKLESEGRDLNLIKKQQNTLPFA